MHNEKPPVKIRYEYEKEDGLRLNYVHGIFGGINPQGEIELNFYSESDKFPAFSEQIIAPDGSMGHEVLPAEDVKHVVRHVHSKLLINYYMARAVLEWLEDKVDILESEGDNPEAFFAPPSDDGFRQ